MEAALQLAGLEVLAPFRGDCPTCGLEVLALELDGLEVVVDVVEVLERFPCPMCAQVAARGHRRKGCSRCGETGWLGEGLPLRGVLLDGDGRARVYVGERDDGEAVHLFHACAEV